MNRVSAYVMKYALQHFGYYLISDCGLLTRLGIEIECAKYKIATFGVNLGSLYLAIDYN